MDTCGERLARNLHEDENSARSCDGMGRDRK